MTQDKYINEIMTACYSGAGNELIRKFIANQLEMYYLERRLAAMDAEHQRDINQLKNEDHG